jgi:polygalacturonase
MTSARARFSILLSVVLCSSLLLAQDMRKVKEPRVPAPCATLTAQLALQSGSLAEADETKLDTARIQEALRKCAPLEAVLLKSDGKNNAFLTGPLKLSAGVTLVVDEGTTLLGSRNPRDYDVSEGSCGLVNDDGKGCKPLITVNKAPDAAIMGLGAIDGRGGAKLIGGKYTWWELAEQARNGGKQNCPRLIQVDESDGFILYGITLRNSPNFHVMVRDTNGFTAWGVKIDTPKNARNTDGIDPSSSTNVTITQSYIRAGDDNVAIKSTDKGGPAAHMSIVDNHFYWGHGMSIGSETDGGVNAIRVTNLTIDGADNGLRIKSDSSRGGEVVNILYDNVCIRDSKHPILITPEYEGKQGTKIPVFQLIRMQNVSIQTPGKINVAGYDADHPLKLQLDAVSAPFVMKPKPTDTAAKNAIINMGPNKVTLRFTGENVRMGQIPLPSGAKAGDAPSCKGAFVEFPSGPPLSALQQTAPAAAPAK